MEHTKDASDSPGPGAVRPSKPYHQADKFSHVSIDHAAKALSAQNEPQRFRIPISDHDDTASSDASGTLAGASRLKSALSSPRSSISSATAVRRGAWKASGKPSGSASRIQSVRTSQNRSASSSSHDQVESQDDSRSPTYDVNYDQNPQGVDVADHPAWHRVKERSGSTAPGTLSYLPAVGNAKASSLTGDDLSDDDSQQPGHLDPGWNTSAPALPSPTAADEVEKQGASAGDYDWANFIYAYSRGRWNPGLIPQPPGQSTVYPGTKVKVNTIPLASATDKPNANISHGRRPSLEYKTLSGLASNSDPRAMLEQPTALHDDESARLASVSPATAEHAVRHHPDLSASSTRNTAAHKPLHADATKPAPPFNLDVFAGLRPSSASVSAVMQRPSNEDTQGKEQLTVKQPAGHAPHRSVTVPDALPSQENSSMIPQQEAASLLPAASWNEPRSDPNAAGPTLHPSAAEESPYTVPADYHRQTSLSPAAKNKPSQGLQRPTLPQNISHLDLNSSPRSKPALSKRVTSGLSNTVASADQTDVETPHRPGPTPVQRSESEVGRPAVWQSAPEGLSLFAEAMMHQASSSAADHYANYGIDRIVDNNIVAGLRRAARRTSVEKAERALVNDHGKISKFATVSHSASFPGSSPRPSISASGPRDGVQPLSHLSSGRISISSQGASLSGNPTVSVAHFIGGKPSGETRIDLRGTVTHSSAGANETSQIQPLTYSGGEIDPRDVSMAAQASMRPHAPPPSSSARRVNDYLAEGRRAELFYRDNGYLPAILPPQERQRLHALARYGPPKIAGDANFERIAHLVKLVFSSKLVLITLVGENEQIFQTQMGGGGKMTTSYLQNVAGARNCSFCSHAILQDSDEPIVILDAPKDWRFSGNPLVQSSPDIRFYAGSPLRTSDGFNIGSLCVIDDKPRTEFGPRLRHTLKEFARVVMREMELLRDRIQLGMRDRMQRSVEMFTKECLEMDSEEADSDAVATPQGQMGTHKVFHLAAESMREALQVTGAVIFDLSHFELIDSHQSDFVRSDLGAGTSSKVYFSNPNTSRDTATPSTRSNDASGRSNSLTAFDGTLGVETADSPFGSPSAEQSVKARRVPPMNVLGSSEHAAIPTDRNDPVPLSHHVQVAEFLRLHRTGKFYPFAPPPFRSLLPHGVNSLLLVPIFGLNKQPFALLCAYIAGKGESIGLEELQVSGLQYIRALGMIVLSATLKKDIMMADKAKSNFISNISHELRTPLHGILAAAELLNETKMNATQGSYLETVEACGKSLLELVNHVLDFTKLSGSTRQGSKNGHTKYPCDIVKLIQEVCESSWIGQMAKRLDSSHTGIGSVYAPPSGAIGSDNVVQARARMARENKVETVIDIAMRSDGWLVNCDIGGIRRVLMNLIGNSLKFTSEGFVHVSLREVQSSSTHVMIELSVTDTGLGISRAFLEEQLFHPFTQENPHGTGTGLGLSIVNSIVQSPSLNGKIDVWSTEGEGTEIRVTCELEVCQESDFEGAVYRPALAVDHKYKVSFLGFGDSRGDRDLETALKGYFLVWWEFDLATQSTAEVPARGDIVLINDDLEVLKRLQSDFDGDLPPVIFLTASRGDVDVANACEEYHAAGGIARMLFKPAGPAKLEGLVDFCLQCLERKESGERLDSEQTKPTTPLPSPGGGLEEAEAGQDVDYFARRSSRPDIRHSKGHDFGSFNSAASTTPRADKMSNAQPEPVRATTGRDIVAERRPSYHMSPDPPSPTSSLLRRHSTEARMEVASGDDQAVLATRPDRPLLPARSITYHEPRLHKHVVMSPSALRSPRRDIEAESYFDRPSSTQPDTPGSTISLEGGDGAVLKSAVSASKGSVSGPSSDGGMSKKSLRILSVEDNAINRKVIAAYLNKMGINFVEATNGQEGIDEFQAAPAHYFDVILMDLSMPVLDGISAIAAIRKIEAERNRGSGDYGATRTGRGSALTQYKSKSADAHHAKIFALTGRSTDEDKRKAFKTGADGYIVKPLSFKVLSSLLRMLNP